MDIHEHNTNLGKIGWVFLKKTATNGAFSPVLLFFNMKN
jgi:hypothetical protein